MNKEHVENAIRLAKQKRMRELPATCPIGTETAEAIIDDYIAELTKQLERGK